MINQQIVALEKVAEKPQQGAKWNYLTLIWSVLYQNKRYDIELQITYLSSKRLVKVNGDHRHTTLATFGYQSSFFICENLKGRIKQNGIKFQYQLYVNDISFTQLEKRRPNYQPISLISTKDMTFNNSYDFNQNIPKKVQKKQENRQNYIINNEIPRQTNKINERPIQKIESIKNQQKISQMDKIKNTQKQLMKILKASKNNNKS